MTRKDRLGMCFGSSVGNLTRFFTALQAIQLLRQFMSDHTFDFLPLGFR